MPDKPTSPPWVIHVISDATGNLGSHMVHSVLTQFPGESFTVKYHLFVSSSKDVEAHLSGLEGKTHLVLHRLLVPRHKKLATDLCKRLGIPEFDLTGGLVGFLEAQTGLKPANDPSRLHRADEHYFRRIQAMEFTAQHDDNRRMDTLEEADVVLVGLSRVSKSPTSTWLGFLGYKAANVAISKETGFPKELDRVSGRTVALTTRPRTLWEIRRRRFDNFKDKISEKDLEQLPYYDLRSIVSEVSWAEKEYRARDYPVFDITGQTVEEVASRIVTTLNPKRPDLLDPL